MRLGGVLKASPWGVYRWRRGGTRTGMCTRQGCTSFLGTASVILMTDANVHMCAPLTIFVLDYIQY